MGIQKDFGIKELKIKNIGLTKMRLYHGSAKKIKGKFLIPKKPHDLGNQKENLIKGVYATDVKNSAIAMAIISSKGVISGTLNYKKKSVIYEGWPKQKYIYLYHFPIQTFKRTSKESHQLVSKKSVKPIKIEKLNIKDYLKLVRKATKKEIENFFKKYKIKRDKKQK